MPESFQFPVQPARDDAWVPIEQDPFPQMRLRDGRLIHVVARLGAGGSIAQASGEMRTVAARLASEYPATNRGWSASVSSLHEDWFGESRQGFLLLLGAVGFVLLIA